MEDDVVQRIKERVNIVDVISQYVHLKRAGRNFQARCPFHKERTPSFMVSPERGTYVCFGCGEKGDVFSFLERMEGIDFKTALKQLAEKAGIELPAYAPRPQEEVNHEDRLFAVLEAATQFYITHYAAASDVQEYVQEKRGITPATVAHWRIGYAPAAWRTLTDALRAEGFTPKELVDAGLSLESTKRAGEYYDRFRGRIMFPITDPQGRVIAFSGRYFAAVPGYHEEGEPAKYVNSPETELFKKSRALFGIAHARAAIRKADCILLVEGQFDVVMAHQCGLPFAVAISGTALTPDHLAFIARMTKKLILALDADSAGVRSGLKSAAMAYQAGFDVKVPTFPDGQDPADVGRADPEALRAAVRSSVPAVEFFLTYGRAQNPDLRAYRKWVSEHVLPLVAAIPNHIDRDHFMTLVASRIGVTDAAVRDEVEKLLRAPKRDYMNPTQEIVEMPGATGAGQAVVGSGISSYSMLEQSVGLLHTKYAQEADIRITERLVALLGVQRLATLRERVAPDDEAFLFVYEQRAASLAEDPVPEAPLHEQLLAAVELSVINERLTDFNARLRMGEGDAAALVREISELKQREQQLRYASSITSV